MKEFAIVENIGITEEEAEELLKILDEWKIKQKDVEIGIFVRYNFL